MDVAQYHRLVVACSIMSVLSDQTSAQLSLTGWELDQTSSSSVYLNLQLGESPGYEETPYDGCMLPFLFFLIFLMRAAVGADDGCGLGICTESNTNFIMCGMSGCSST
jgi:hypothetical protein